MLLLAGAMDGSTTVLNAASGKVLARHKSHAKYCVRVRWAPDGQRFVSCSWDHTLAVHKCNVTADGASIELLKTETFLSQVQDVEFIAGHAKHETAVLALALKTTNYLRLYDLNTLKVITLLLAVMPSIPSLLVCLCCVSGF